MTSEVITLNLNQGVLECAYVYCPGKSVCDDDRDDQLLIKHAFAEACVEAKFRFTSDGVELTGNILHRYLIRMGVPLTLRFTSARPQYGPLHGCLQALEWIKSHPHHRAIPVVVYTTSREPKEIRRYYAAGANSFMTKCSSIEGLVHKVKAFSKYWTGRRSCQEWQVASINEFPRHPV